MNRDDFQQLADIRIDEAQALLAQGKFSGAYYLAGYAVECALKACIARRTNQFDFPDKDLALQSYVHDLAKLRTLADPDGQFQSDAPTNSPLLTNWGVVVKWKEKSRYLQSDQAEAEGLIEAISDPAHGVLQWVKRNW